MESIKTNKIYIPEVKGYTPVQLSLAGPKPNFEVVRLLFRYGAKLTVHDYQTNDNIIQLACSTNDNQIIEYVVN